MVKKQDVLQLIDDQLKRTADSYTMDDAAEVVLLMIRNKVENMPEAVVRGEWIETKYYTWECGVCGFHPFKGYIPKEPNFNFCPNCGADMRGEK